MASVPVIVSNSQYKDTSIERGIQNALKDADQRAAMLVSNQLSTVYNPKEERVVTTVLLIFDK